MLKNIRNHFTTLLSLMMLAMLILPGCSAEDVATGASVAVDILNEMAEETADEEAGLTVLTEEAPEMSEGQDEADMSAESGMDADGMESAMSPDGMESAADPSDDRMPEPEAATLAPETTLSEEEAFLASIDEDEEYSSKDEVAAYLYLYGHLPSNYITKNEAKDLGWVSNRGNLWDVAPGCSIGGDYFGNYEGLLPKKKGRSYYECDIDFEGGWRNDKRIIFSNDGLIYYTDDHYASFELLYGEE